MRSRSYSDRLLRGLARLGLLLLAVGFLGAGVKAAPLTIKGVVTNAAAARTTGTGPEKWTVVWDDTYLQLVLLSPGGSYPVSTDSKGRISVPSNLPKTEMPKQGPFTIVCGELKPGTYLVVAQKAYLTPQRPAWLLKGGQPVQIQVTEHTVPVVDLGDLTTPMNR